MKPGMFCRNEPASDASHAAELHANRHDTRRADGVVNLSSSHCST